MVKVLFPLKNLKFDLNYHQLIFFNDNDKYKWLSDNLFEGNDILKLLDKASHVVYSRYSGSKISFRYNINDIKDVEKYLSIKLIVTKDARGKILFWEVNGTQPYGEKTVIYNGTINICFNYNWNDLFILPIQIGRAHVDRYDKNFNPDISPIGYNAISEEFDINLVNMVQIDKTYQLDANYSPNEEINEVLNSSTTMIYHCFLENHMRYNNDQQTKVLKEGEDYIVIKYKKDEFWNDSNCYYINEYGRKIGNPSFLMYLNDKIYSHGQDNQKKYYWLNKFAPNSNNNSEAVFDTFRNIIKIDYYPYFQMNVDFGSVDEVDNEKYVQIFENDNYRVVNKTIVYKDLNGTDTISTDLDNAIWPRVVNQHRNLLYSKKYTFWDKIYDPDTEKLWTYEDESKLLCFPYYQIYLQDSDTRYTINNLFLKNGPIDFEIYQGIAIDNGNLFIRPNTEWFKKFPIIQQEGFFKYINYTKPRNSDDYKTLIQEQNVKKDILWKSFNTNLVKVALSGISSTGKSASTGMASGGPAGAAIGAATAVVDTFIEGYKAYLDYTQSLYNLDQMFTLLNQNNLHLINTGNQFLNNISYQGFKPWIITKKLPDFYLKNIGYVFHKWGVRLNLMLNFGEVFNTRYYFNFIFSNISLDSIRNDLHNEIRNKIAKLLQNGITFWYFRNPTTFKGVGNYNYNNAEMKFK